MTLTVRLTDGLRVEAQGGAHRFVLDEPASNGGADGGPTPTQTLLAALAGCTAMTLRLYSRRKGWPLEGVRIGASVERGAQGGDAPNRFAMDVVLEGPLDAEQRQRLLEIAGRCPVHRLLEGPNAFEERLVESLEAAT